MTANHRMLDAADVLLIEKVKSTPTLYDPSNAEFKFAYRKEQLWESVAVVLGMSAVDAKRRWTCLRDRYSRELKQMRLHPEKCEYGQSDFFRRMDFLRKFVRKRRERRRTNVLVKYDNSWDGSNEDANSKPHNKTEQPTPSSDIYEDTQDSYDAKMEMESAKTEEEGYPEFVEVDGQVSEEAAYEEFVDQPAPDNSQSSVDKNVANCEGQTARHPFIGTGTSITNTPSLTTALAFCNHAANVVTGDDRSSSFPLSASYKPTVTLQQQPNETPPIVSVGGGAAAETEDDFFCKTIGSYLRQLSRRYKIKAKVEMFKILEKYIELEETSNTYHE